HVDIDQDNDGIVNCSESFGDVSLNLSNVNAGNFSIQTYSNSFVGVSTAVNSEGAPAVAVIGDANGKITLNTGAGIDSEIKHQLDFNNPVSIELSYIDVGNPNELMRSDTEFLIRVPTNQTITVLNPDGQLLIDTNYDGIYENNITGFSSFEIRFRLNSSSPLTAGTGTFSFRTHLTEMISMQMNNLSDNAR
ncbi:hypothetical protein RZS08_14920, partial [Arthrospira platensis SPKY1]|nr:hypothetical protein [Arthrospira platensis SPKY1]